MINPFKQSLMNSEIIDSLGSVIKKIQKLKVLAMAVVYESNPELFHDMSQEYSSLFTKNDY